MRPSTLLSFPFLSFPFHLIIHTEMTSLSRSSGAPAQASLYSPRHHTLSLFLYYIYTPLLFTYMYTLATSLAYIHIYTPSPKPPLLSFLLLPLETRSGGAVRSSDPAPSQKTAGGAPAGCRARHPASPQNCGTRGLGGPITSTRETPALPHTTPGSRSSPAPPEDRRRAGLAAPKRPDHTLSGRLGGSAAESRLPHVPPAATRLCDPRAAPHPVSGRFAAPRPSAALRRRSFGAAPRTGGDDPSRRSRSPARLPSRHRCRHPSRHRSPARRRRPAAAARR